MSSLESMPDFILAETPLGKPPQGVSSNFVDLPTSGTHFIIVGGVIVPIMLAFYAIRIHARYRLIRRLAWDDCAFRSLFPTMSKRLTTPQ